MPPVCSSSASSSCKCPLSIFPPAFDFALPLHSVFQLGRHLAELLDGQCVPSPTDGGQPPHLEAQAAVFSLKLCRGHRSFTCHRAAYHLSKYSTVSKALAGCAQVRAARAFWPNRDNRDTPRQDVLSILSQCVLWGAFNAPTTATTATFLKGGAPWLARFPALKWYTFGVIFHQPRQVGQALALLLLVKYQVVNHCF